MSKTVSLFDGKVTAWQQALLAGWALALVSVFGLWAPGAVMLLMSGDVPNVLLAIGQIIGLLATFFALTQFLLMGRIAWIEGAFGLDRLASYHRFNGYAAIILIILHPIFIVAHHAVENNTNYFAEYVDTLNAHQYAWLALVGELLFIAVVFSSIYIARKHLKFETWYYVHLMVYGAIVLSALHQFVNGSSLLRSSAALYYWLGLYLFVGLNLLIWRLGLLIVNFYKFDFRVARVVQETPTTTSIYISGRRLKRLHIKPGQFILIRILTRKLFLQEHPFSVSSIVTDDTLRLTIRHVGDYTTDITSLKPGARVVVSGPFGRFTKTVAVTSKRLFIAGGVGITPLRAMAEEASRDGIDAVLLYALRTPDDAPLKEEIDELAATAGNFTVHYVYSDSADTGSLPRGRLDGAMIASLVPDFSDRDMYLCGPPPMTDALVGDLLKRKINSEQLHFERFRLHN